MAEIDLLLKLFDTLKDQLKEMQQLSQALLTNQNNIGNYMRSLPMDEVKQLLKDHSKESTDEIGTCTETVELKATDIIDSVNSMKAKVDRMVLVIKVAFSLFGAAVLIGGISYKYAGTPDKTAIEESHEELKQEIKDDVNEAIQEALKEFKK